MKKPFILVTNDDGIDAPGLRHLYQALYENYRLEVVAPLQEQSGVGLSISVRTPLYLKRHTWPDEKTVYSVNGTPTDCVKIALSVHLDEYPDLIVSGINRGTNSGRNILYSGTVGAAIEGVYHNIPSIAFSCYDYEEPQYTEAVDFIHPLVSYYLNNPPPKGTCLNVNFPPKHAQPIKGIKLARHGQEYWSENPQKGTHPSGHHYYWLGGKLETFDEVENTDVTWLRKGYIACVPVCVKELTDLPYLDQSRRRFEEHFGDFFDR